VNVSRPPAGSDRCAGSARSEIAGRSGCESRSRSGGGAAGAASAREAPESEAEESSFADSAAAFAVFDLRGRGVAARFFLVSPALAREDGVSSSVLGGRAMKSFGRCGEISPR
jgi:hypothetical protein